MKRIIYSGFLRTWDVVKDNQFENIIEYGDELFFYTTERPSAISNESTWVQMGEQFLEYDVRYKGNAAGETSIINTINQWRNRRDAFRLAGVDETTKVHVIARTDTTFFGKVDFTITPNVVYIPSGQDYGGLNDQFAFGDYAAMQYYCSLYERFDEYFNEGVKFHPETMLAYHLEKYNGYQNTKPRTDLQSMTKLIIFDLDGVLCDCKDLHYEALNEALKFCGFNAITRSEHLAVYDGLNTKEKLNRLGIPEERKADVFDYKQKFTNNLIQTSIDPNPELRRVLHKLKDDGYRLVVASNSIRFTINSILDRVGIKYLFEQVYSNEDVTNPKPHPEMYMKAMMDAKVSPAETVIVEDSHIGRKGAAESGALVCPVQESRNVSYTWIKAHCLVKRPITKWNPGKLNVLIPMAGEGSRFSQAGYTFPKPLIEVRGEPMIKVVVDNLNVEAQFIFIVREWQFLKYNLKSVLSLIAPGCKIVIADILTDGAACTAMLAESLINNDTPLLIANSDQFVEFSSAEFLYSMNTDGGLITFENTHPKWSYVQKDENGFCTRVVEKNPISNEATVGIYYWAKGSDFCKYADRMIEANDRYNNEFYIAPVYQHAIDDGKKIKTFKVNKMWGLGTPEDLDNYLKYKE